ncbi:hypothetical protein CLV92_103364 [Kineococcus xinjiangensis]|uniref:Uncharacterized protein n=1 Tax=Kineococcus xinjiangensis TaxID=512762 RepID=A0A2S6IU99_9ACTN|nr:hypothetical protein [Kineococcus xinjiangensis]PPK97829.1 hypothetical protein CLV92_103364 [Kineococcus xinjiangensis]
MRWEELFADTAGQWAEQERRDLDWEVADRIRAELGRVRLVDRLLAAGEEELELHVGGSAALRGSVLDCAAEWVLLASSEGGRTHPGPSRRVLVPVRAVVSVRGAPRHVGVSTSTVAERRSFASALRALSAARCPVRVLLGGADREVSHQGTLDRVGADHVDLLEHGPDELPGRERRVTTIALRAVVAVVEESGLWPA